MWYYNDTPITEIPDNILGFVYCITNLQNGMKYIGKKTFLFRKTKRVNGKKKKVLVSSDWKEYFGSNKILKEKVKELGKENFRRDILHFCTSKGEMNYMELVEQITRKVLEQPNLYYNEWISVKISRSHIKKLLK